MANKFTAAKEYDSGVKKALFRESLIGFKWEDQTDLFMAGYHFGSQVLKPMLFEHRNEQLRERGINEIGIIKTQGDQANGER